VKWANLTALTLLTACVSFSHAQTSGIVEKVLEAGQLTLRPVRDVQALDKLGVTRLPQQVIETLDEVDNALRRQLPPGMVIDDPGAVVDIEPDQLLEAEVHTFERSQCRIIHPTGSLTFNFEEARPGGTVRAASQVISTCTPGRKYRIVAMQGVTVINELPVVVTSDSGETESRRLILFGGNGRPLGASAYQGGNTPNSMLLTAIVDAPFSLSGPISLKDDVTLAVIPD